MILLMKMAIKVLSIMLFGAKNRFVQTVVKYSLIGIKLLIWKMIFNEVHTNVLLVEMR